MSCSGCVRPNIGVTSFLSTELGDHLMELDAYHIAGFGMMLSGLLMLVADLLFRWSKR